MTAFGTFTPDYFPRKDILDRVGRELDTELSKLETSCSDDDILDWEEYEAKFSSTEEFYREEVKCEGGYGSSWEILSRSIRSDEVSHLQPFPAREKEVRWVTGEYPGGSVTHYFRVA